MTESHLRRLSVTMRGLEEALLEVQRALAPSPELAMSVYQDDIPDSARPAIGELIGQLREEIRVVKARYGLGSEVISNRRRISAKLTIISIDLTEATSRYMQAYGAIPKEEQGGLDPQISKIISLVDEVNKLVR